MNVIDASTTDEKGLREALKGEYGSVCVDGLCITKAGRLAILWGAFGEDTEVVKIPSFPARFPVLFSAEDCACGSVIEPMQGQANVPNLVRGKRFTIMGFVLLNTL